MGEIPGRLFGKTAPGTPLGRDIGIWGGPQKVWRVLRARERTPAGGSPGIFKGLEEPLEGGAFTAPGRRAP